MGSPLTAPLTHWTYERHWDVALLPVKPVGQVGPEDAVVVVVVMGAGVGGGVAG